MRRIKSWLLTAAFTLGLVCVGTYIWALAWGLPGRPQQVWTSSYYYGTPPGPGGATFGVTRVETAADWSGFAVAFADDWCFLEGWETETLLGRLCVVPILPVSRVEDNGGPWQFWIYGRHPGDHVWRVAVSTPLMLLLVAGPPLLWWCAARYRGQHRPGHCGRCDYDLRGTPDHCPECGTKV